MKTCLIASGLAIALSTAAFAQSSMGGQPRGMSPSGSGTAVGADPSPGSSVGDGATSSGTAQKRKSSTTGSKAGSSGGTGGGSLDSSGDDTTTSPRGGGSGTLGR